VRSKLRTEVRDIERTGASRDELAERIAHHLAEDGSIEAAPGLFLYRSSVPAGPRYGVSVPCFCVIAQGSKEVLLGKERFRYDASHYLLASVELPIVGHVIEASKERPYLSVRLVLDPAVVTAVLIEAGLLSSRAVDGVRGLAVSRLDDGLLDAVTRLVRLIDAPRDYAVLAPLVAREIVYRLSLGEQGGRLRQIATSGGRMHRIARAIELVRENCSEPLEIPALARQLGMSISGFHHHFKAVTAMSPLQFQKQLRLQEARRLLLTGDVDASTAGYRVGYDDRSHFNRLYKKAFGEPPLRDVERLRGAAASRQVRRPPLVPSGGQTRPRQAASRSRPGKAAVTSSSRSARGSGR
jgi:AraC-like DNA-binding protein